MRPRDVWSALVDLALPDHCPGCDLPAPPPACPSCLALLRGRPRRAAPDPCPTGLVVPWAVTAYAGAVPSLLRAHKEQGRLSLTRPLGAALSRAVLHALDLGGAEALVLVPVPSSRSAVRARGHDHTLRLARAAAARLRVHGHPASAVALLRQRRRVADQAALTHAARQANLRHALDVHQARLRRLPTGTVIVVIDDVITTGATLAEAGRALRAAGRPATATAVVAATRRHRAQRAPSDRALPSRAGRG